MLLFFQSNFYNAWMFDYLLIDILFYNRLNSYFRCIWFCYNHFLFADTTCRKLVFNKMFSIYYYVTHFIALKN